MAPDFEVMMYRVGVSIYTFEKIAQTITWILYLITLPNKIQVCGCQTLLFLGLLKDLIEPTSFYVFA
jgi:hypothetical protein